MYRNFFKIDRSRSAVALFAFLLCFNQALLGQESSSSSVEDYLASGEGDSKFGLTLKVSNANSNSLGSFHLTSSILSVEIGATYEANSKQDYFVDISTLSETLAFGSDGTDGTDETGERKTSGGFEELAIGGRFTLRAESKSPGVDLDIQISALKDIGVDSEDLKFFSGHSLGLSIYRTLDPVVVSLGLGWTQGSATSGVRNYLDLENDEVELVKKNGPFSAYLKPGIAFAINNDIIVFSNFSPTLVLPDGLSRTKKSKAYFSTLVDFGFGLAFGSKRRLVVALSSDMSQSETTEMTVSGSIRF